MQSSSMLKSVKSSNKSTLLASSRPSVQRARLVRPASAETDAASVTYSFSSNGASSNGASAGTAAATSTVAAPAPQPSTPSSSSSSSSSVVTSIKLQLLELVAALDRGRLASHADKAAVERLVASLEGSGAGLAPFAGTPAPVEGRWELLYTNKEVFRASPFFSAFQGGLVQSKELAEAIFAFTDAIPGADILGAHQTVSLLSGSLISEVGMRVWPGLSGTVVTTSRISVASPTRLELVVENTRVAGSSFGPFLDNVAVPVEQMINQLRGEGAAAASYEVTFVDAQLRVTRAGDQLLLHRRVV